VAGQLQQRRPPGVLRGSQELRPLRLLVLEGIARAEVRALQRELERRLVRVERPELWEL